MEYKQLTEFFQQEIKAEDVATRKCLERIPESIYGFKPHERSMELGHLAQLVSDIPRWVSSMIIDTIIDFATYPQFKLSDTAALLKHYDNNLKGALDALKNITTDQLKEEFSLRKSGEVLYSQPKLKAIGEAVNHWVHHRGQLTVYMRLNEIAVPSIYGPSADDKGFSRG